MRAKKPAQLATKIKRMKKTFLFVTTAIVFATLGSPGALANELDDVAGHWVAKVNDGSGQSFKQTLVIRQNKFTFEVVPEGGQTVLYAEGDLKVEALGPFKAAKFYNIRGGASAAELQSVDDERTVIYSLDGNEMTVAANFDKERAEPPMATKYVKTAATDESKALVIDKIVMHKSPQSADWFLCFDASVGETSKRFNVPDKAYQKDELTILTDLIIPNVSPGATCKFVMKLDDVAGDECGEDMDNRSAGSFAITDSGAQEFKPEGQWRYTLYWHLK